jgi:hypothetical protein
VDKGRQVCSQLDTALMQTFSLESGEVRLVCAGLQSGQLSAAPGPSR